MLTRDVDLPSDAPTDFLRDEHARFILQYESKPADDLTSLLTEFLRMSGLYWGVTALDLLGRKGELPKGKIIQFIKDCQDQSDGGFAAFPGHDSHILYTLSAIQLLTLYDSLTEVNVEKCVKFVSGLQRDDGSFQGDSWGEIDTRFSMCALATLALLDSLTVINEDKATSFLVSCLNFDGAFGCRPGSESHAGQVYCCLGSLAILGRLDVVRPDQLGHWLAERQLPSGGLNGRPEKLPDVCYSWWILSSLKIIDRMHWIDGDALERFILASQDSETGGFADRPGDIPDPFHTLFGIAGLSLLGKHNLKAVDPVFCMPVEALPEKWRFKEGQGFPSRGLSQ
ncbi:unnamed protein product [Cyprideis torosa]|uniref:Geranylgeranyl transferase type-2 subunit beta n=1 Tax=Cyprideis torosa TaxID=163714 RepID=A0A7R8ZTM7_9CRUS|nr:unnamed protein product [Cyprideis torosa]CAG0898426.1 unnamed protein product [Cyprideis torosa]